jgi:geranylgeranyl reductase family protein
VSDQYDVIICGAGPAGGTAAYYLGQAGKRVLVLEKEHLPRYKTCGGGLSIDFLKRQFPFSFEPALQSQARAMSYAFDRRIVTIPLNPGHVGMVMRDQFDALLLAHARVEVRQGVSARSVIETDDHVTVETQAGECFEGRYLIGADGANSMVAHSLGLRQDRVLVAGIEAEAPVSPPILMRFGDRPVFIFGEINFGYLWIFPKGNHLSVGIAALHPHRGELQATLQRVMTTYGISLKDIPLHGHPIPIYTGKGQIATRRTLLVGDAAGLADPLSGEGIRYAIKSGRLAAEAILSGHPERYPKMIFRKIGLNHLFALGASLLFYKFQDLCLFLGAPNPFTTQAIVDLLADRANTADIILRSIITLPLYLFTEILAALVSSLGGPQYRDQIRSRVYLGNNSPSH